MVSKFGIITEYIFADKKFRFPKEAQGLIDYSKKRKEVYVIHSKNKVNSDGTILAVNVNKNKLEKIFIEGFCIYSALVGKSIPEYGVYNSMTSHLETFCDLLESLQPYEKKQLIKISNPLNTLIYNLSKNYLIDFSSELPFIKTKKIKSIDELTSIEENSSQIIIKPLISERSRGAMILQNMNKDKLINYFYRYLDKKKFETLYGKVLSKQGIIMQPFLKEFNTHGERKISVINGKITLAKIVIPKKGEVYSGQNGGIKERHTPTEEEKSLALKVFKIFNKKYPSNYMRVDLFGPNGDLKINEIEALNPNFSTSSEMYTSSELENHYEKLLEFCS